MKLSCSLNWLQKYMIVCEHTSRFPNIWSLFAVYLIYVKNYCHIRHFQTYCLACTNTISALCKHMV